MSHLVDNERACTEAQGACTVIRELGTMYDMGKYRDTLMKRRQDTTTLFAYLLYAVTLHDV